MSTEAIIICLGNPEPERTKTRHNVGWMVADALMPSELVDWDHKDGVANAIPFCCAALVKPLTGMNSSGEALDWIVENDRFDATPNAPVVIVYDDISIPFGSIKVKKGGSSGHHNGVQSVLDHLGGREDIRIKVGIGMPSEGTSVYDHVLGNFTDDEMTTLQGSIIPKVATVISTYVMKGYEAAHLALSKMN